MIGSYMKERPVKDSGDISSMMREMMSLVLEEALDGELEEELGYSRYDYKNKDTKNSRNGHSKKTMHTSYGDMELDIPRDRNGEFEPQIIQKHQDTLTQDMENKILSMYAKGITQGDIRAYFDEIYGVEVSESTISRITDLKL